MTQINQTEQIKELNHAQTRLKYENSKLQTELEQLRAENKKLKTDATLEGELPEHAQMIEKLNDEFAELQRDRDFNDKMADTFECQLDESLGVGEKFSRWCLKAFPLLPQDGRAELADELDELLLRNENCGKHTEDETRHDEYWLTHGRLGFTREDNPPEDE